jgi:hypothetical protein
MAAVWIYGSGMPYTNNDLGFYLNIPNKTLQYYMLEPSPNIFKLPDYHRFDISATYTLKYKWYFLKTEFSIINLFNHNNIKSLGYNLNSAYNNKGQLNYILEKTTTNSLGFTPNLSLNFMF